MPYILPCTCGEKTLVHRSQAGCRIACPECHQPIEIPTIRGFSRLEFESDANEAEDLTHRTPSRWTPLRGLFATLCFVTALMGLGRASLYGVFRYSNPTPYSEEDLLRAAEQNTSKLSPVETWDVWRFIQEKGLGRKGPPEMLIKKRELEKRDHEITYWAIAGAVGLLGLIVCARWRSKPSVFDR